MAQNVVQTWAEQSSAGSAPAAGKWRIYPKTDNKWYVQDEAGTEYELAVLTGSATAAPVGATYIVQTTNATLTNEQVLASLATGLMKVNTTTGVIESVTTSAGVAALISDETGSGALVFGTSPTIVTPTIASFANATHTHQNAAGGGTLDAAAVGSGTLDNARVNFASPAAIGSGTPAAGTFTVGTVAQLVFTASTELTIASGAVTAGAKTFYTVDTEGDAASDDLDTINGGAAGETLILRANNGGRTVVLTTAGNIVTPTGSSISLDETYKVVWLIYDGDLSKWVVSFYAAGTGTNYQTIRVGGSDQTQRAAVNFIAGTNITLTPGDDAGNNETELTIAAGATPGGGAPPSINEGRLTLTSGTSVTTSDVTGASAATVYWALHTGNYIGLYDGVSAWTLHALSEKSISLSGLLPYSIHDVFMDYNAGTPVLATLPWTAGATGPVAGATNATPIVITDVAHGLTSDDIVSISGVGGNTAANGEFRVTVLTADTFSLQTLAGANVAGSGVYTSGGTWYKSNYVGTRATALTRQDGIYVLTGATDWRYLGTIRITATAGQTESSDAKRFVWNYYHPVVRKIKRADATVSWTYAVASVRQARNDLANQVEVVCGVQLNALRITYQTRFQGSATGDNIELSIGVNSRTVAGGDNTGLFAGAASSFQGAVAAHLIQIPAVGYTYYTMQENSISTFVVTLYGSPYGALIGEWMC